MSGASPSAVRERDGAVGLPGRARGIVSGSATPGTSVCTLADDSGRPGSPPPERWSRTRGASACSSQGIRTPRSIGAVSQGEPGRGRPLRTRTSGRQHARDRKALERRGRLPGDRSEPVCRRVRHRVKLRAHRGYGHPQNTDGQALDGELGHGLFVQRSPPRVSGRASPSRARRSARTARSASSSAARIATIEAAVVETRGPMRQSDRGRGNLESDLPGTGSARTSRSGSSVIAHNHALGAPRILASDATIDATMVRRHADPRRVTPAGGRGINIQDGRGPGGPSNASVRWSVARPEPRRWRARHGVGATIEASVVVDTQPRAADSTSVLASVSSPRRTVGARAPRNPRVWVERNLKAGIRVFERRRQRSIGRWCGRPSRRRRTAASAMRWSGRLGVCPGQRRLLQLSPRARRARRRVQLRRECNGSRHEARVQLRIDLDGELYMGRAAAFEDAGGNVAAVRARA